MLFYLVFKPNLWCCFILSLILSLNPIFEFDLIPSLILSWNQVFAASLTLSSILSLSSVFKNIYNLHPVLNLVFNHCLKSSLLIFNVFHLIFRPSLCSCLEYCILKAKERHEFLVKAYQYCSRVFAINQSVPGLHYFIIDTHCTFIVWRRGKKILYQRSELLCGGVSLILKTRSRFRFGDF